jgi:homocysteine S-methyltransferase
VIGSIGPSGIDWKSASDEERNLALDALERQFRVLLDEGVDGFIFETFAFAQELYGLLERTRAQTDLPILAFASYPGEGATSDDILVGSVAKRLAELGADVIGANCADGPHEHFALIEDMLGYDRPVAIMPNAGYPKLIDGRTIYMATPEYFGVYAKKFLKRGVRVLGGCCGTTPEHIRKMKNSARMMRNESRTEKARERSREISESHDEAIDAVSVAERSRLAQKVESGEGFVVSVEVNPPTGLDVSKQIGAARMLKAAGVDVINIADGPRASCRMSNWSLALKVREELDMEAIVHFCSRDKNLLGLQSDLLAYHVMGIRNLVIITGDPPKLGDYPHATAVFDLDSPGMIRLADGLNRGIDPAGRSIGGHQTEFFILTGAEPAALDYEREIRRLEEKAEAGATAVMTQPVYDPRVLESFLDDIAHLDLDILVGLLPLASHRNAEFLHNEVPGMQVPSEIRSRMEDFGSGERARAEGVKIAQEALLAVRDRVRGAYIMPPFGRYEAAVEILECVGYEKPEEFLDDWRY